MKQVEEIQKAKSQLAKIKHDIEEAQSKLNKNITEQIEQKETKRKKAFNEINTIKKAFVSPITDNPEVYISGSSHLMKKELWEQSYEYQQMWYTFMKEFKKIPRVMDLTKTIDRLEKEISDLRTVDYDKLLEKINDLERDQRIKERLIENLKEIGWFRQYAKGVGATVERQKIEAVISERKENFQKKIEKEYLPLMKKSANKYINR